MKAKDSGTQNSWHCTLKGAVSATPLFLFTSGNDKLNCLKEAQKIYLIRLTVGKKTIYALDGNRLLKAYIFLMEGKMATGAFGRARNYR